MHTVTGDLKQKEEVKLQEDTGQLSMDLDYSKINKLPQKAVNISCKDSADLRATGFCHSEFSCTTVA